MKNPTEEWTRYRYIVYTLTVSAMLDHNPTTPHFGILLGYFSRKSSNAEEFVQQISRIRALTFQVAIIYADAVDYNAKQLPMNEEDVLQWVRNRNLTASQVEPPQVDMKTNLLSRGELHYNQDEMDICIQAEKRRRRTQNHPHDRLYQLLQEDGNMVSKCCNLQAATHSLPLSSWALMEDDKTYLHQFHDKVERDFRASFLRNYVDNMHSSHQNLNERVDVSAAFYSMCFNPPLYQWPNTVEESQRSAMEMFPQHAGLPSIPLLERAQKHGVHPLGIRLDVKTGEIGHELSECVALIPFMMPGKPAIILQSNGRVCCFASMIELRQHCEKYVGCSVSPGRTSYQTVRVYSSQATCSASKLRQQSYRAELTRLSKELYKDSKWKPRQQQGQQVVALPLSCLSRMNSAKEYTNALEFAFDESMGVAVAYRGRHHTKDAWLMFSTSSAFSNKTWKQRNCNCIR